MATQIHMRTEKQERQNEEMKRLVEWISKHWDEWKMLCNPAITDTDTRAKRRIWICFAIFYPPKILCYGTI